MTRLLFLLFLCCAKPAPVAPVQGITAVQPVPKDTSWVRYEVSDSMSIQVTFIPHGQGVNVLILPVKKTRKVSMDNYKTYENVHTHKTDKFRTITIEVGPSGRKATVYESESGDRWDVASFAPNWKEATK